MTNFWSDRNITLNRPNFKEKNNRSHNEDRFKKQETFIKDLEECRKIMESFSPLFKIKNQYDEK